MRVTDLLRLETAVQFAFRLFCVILGLMLAPTLLSTLFSSAHLSITDCLALLVLLAAASPLAYWARERRRRRPRQRGGRRGAERTPLAPAAEEDE
jgi:uncharacterized RDD family membrane protein YckC